jgi:hypothetical protein
LAGIAAVIPPARGLIVASEPFRQTVLLFGLEFTTRKWMLESSNRLQFTISAVTREIRAKTRLPD